MITAAIVGAIVSAEDEVGTVTLVVTEVVAAALHSDVIGTAAAAIAAEEMTAVGDHTTVTAVDRMAVTVDHRGVLSVVEGTTEGRMAEVVALVIVVVGTHLVAVVMLVAEGAAVAVTMRCSRSQTRYLFKVSRIRSRNKSSFSILAPLA